jgi:general secretion pathway protein K
MSYQVHLNTRRSQNVIAQEQAWQYAVGAEAAAIAILERDRASNDIDYQASTTEEELWFTPIAITRKLPGNAQLSFAIADLQGRLNLNAVAGEKQEPEQGGRRAPNPEAGKAARAQFARLLSQQGVPTSAKRLENALADWIDADRRSRFPGGAEDDFYTTQDPPHRAGNTRLVDPSALRRIKGFRSDEAAERWNAICPYVTTLPRDVDRINVNTASIPVLASLASELDTEAAEQAVNLRDSEPYESVDDFLQRNPAFNAVDLDTSRLTVSSQYFMVHARVTRSRARVDVYSIVHRPAAGDSGEAEPAKIIYRSTVAPRRMGTTSDDDDEEDTTPCIGQRLTF